MKKFIIIGMGFIYPRHVQAIKDVGGEVIATVDIDESKNPTFTDYRTMLKSKLAKETDYFVICTPNHLHAEHARACLATGKQVLCEKPLTINTDFSGLDGINVVLQLRYHNLLNELKKAIKPSNNNIVLEMKVYRDKHWWSMWRGDAAKSGGPLFGLAIHMFDLLFVLLDEEFDIITTFNSKQKCSGILKSQKAKITYNVEIMPRRDGQTRSFIINGKNFELCNKDNLSFSGMHHLVYEELLKNKGIALLEAKKAIMLINRIWYKQ